MTGDVRIEDIEALRVRAGIDDVELRRDVRGLVVGDLVNVTLLFGAHSAETLAVRIVEIRGEVYTGKLEAHPDAAGLAGLTVDEKFSFTAAHIHSLPKERVER